jgi:hypothetical protein
MVSSFAPKVMRGESAEFVVELRWHFLKRLRIDPSGCPVI